MLDWGVLVALMLLGLLVAVYPLRKRKILFFGALPAVLIFLVAGYAVWGGGPEWQRYKTALHKKAEAEQVLASFGSTDAIVERLKKRLSETPKDAKAWFLLGRVYASKGDFQEANAAYVVAHSLEPKNHEYSLHYAESVWVLHHERFDESTRQLLLGILEENPKQMDALAMLAYDAYARHLNQDAVMYWERLLELMPQASEEADKIRQAIAKVRSQGVLRDAALLEGQTESK